MSIRARILAGCLALTLLTGVLGVIGQAAQRRLGDVALHIYDNAFMAMSYLRSAQVAFAGLAAQSRGDSAGSREAAPSETAQDLLADLDIAAERAMSDRGRARIRQLHADIVAALPRLRGHPADAARVQAGFEMAVEVFAADGFRDRKRVEMLVARQITRSWQVMGASLLAAVTITLLISHLVVPPVRRAVLLAQSIAAGRLDNPIGAAGRGETGDLLRALGVMQAAIASAMARINALMADQARLHAGAMQEQNRQMAAALDNMNQGLCLFDAAGLLKVANRRFAEFFGQPAEGGQARAILAGAGLAAVGEREGESFAALPCEMADGRVFSVSQQAIDGGGWVATYEDMSERLAAERRLAHMARHDMLTGLPNRLLFAERTERLFARQQHDLPLALFCVDLDRFRIINDTLGHVVGDALLRAVAERLMAAAGDGAQVFRLGGNEFGVLVADISGPGGTLASRAQAYAERLAASIAAPFAVSQPPLHVTVAVGVALAADLPVAGPESLLASADLAMARAKASGGGLCLFLPEMDAVVRARRAMELDLREALALDQFTLFYQPQVIVGQGIRGFEALLRWMHPVRGMVGPAVFIPLAEEAGLIGTLGDWVLRQACRTAASWPGGVTVAVNISPLQFQGRDIIADVSAALAESGLPAGRLEVEITEAVMLSDDEAVLETLHGLRATGVRVAMDDFGTGYSSLSYLSRFPFDKLKIDQSFVRGLDGRSDGVAIIRAMIGLGRAMGMTVSAEGVETMEQMKMLSLEGCDELQGFLFGKPQPADCVSEMLRHHGIAVAGKPGGAGLAAAA